MKIDNNDKGWPFGHPLFVITLFLETVCYADSDFIKKIFKGMQRLKLKGII